MSLSYSGPGGAFEDRWIAYALLRDNVQHHLEHGHAGEQFEAIHRIADALGGKRVVLDAKRLCEELERATVLLAKPATELAISQRTRAVIDHKWPPPAGRELETMPVGDWFQILWLPPRLRSLDEAFGHLVRSLRQICAGAKYGDVVEVSDN